MISTAQAARGPAHPELVAEFTRWWRQNNQGGWPCHWRRRGTWTARVIQKLGGHCEVSAPLFWNESMRVVTGELTSTAILAFGYSESALTALMLWWVRSGQTIVDIGTHFGYEARLGCRLVGPGGHVIGFEPNPAAYFLAQRNLATFPQAVLYQKAIASRAGTLALEDRPLWESAFNRVTSGTAGTATINVPATTLDQALANRSRPVDFLKCDAEGFEMDILQGAENILTRDAPLLVLEADMPSEEGANSQRAHDLAKYLAVRGYRAYNFDFDGEFRFGPMDSFPVHHANIAFMKGLCAF